MAPLRHAQPYLHAIICLICISVRNLDGGDPAGSRERARTNNAPRRRRKKREDREELSCTEEPKKAGRRQVTLCSWSQRPKAPRTPPTQSPPPQFKHSSPKLLRTPLSAPPPPPTDLPSLSAPDIQRKYCPSLAVWQNRFLEPNRAASAPPALIRPPRGPAWEKRSRC